MMPKFDERRAQLIKPGPDCDGPVVYAMVRDQRSKDNWALLFAQNIAVAARQPLLVVCFPVADLAQKTLRQVSFSLTGLKDVEIRLARLNIPLHVFGHRPESCLPSFLREVAAGALVLDFSPLKRSREWKKKTAERLSIPVYEVDAHNIVPCRYVSPKMEYAAYTLRPKINRLLPQFLTDIPSLKKHPFTAKSKRPVHDWTRLMASMAADRTVLPAESFMPGEKPARTVLDRFLSRRLIGYFKFRNDPAKAVQSDLSPYLHFGQISAQRVAIEAKRRDQHIKSQEAFLEELIIRRELSDNFCYYNNNYDFFDGFPEWAQKTLNEHRGDPRPYLYTPDRLEAAQTHDRLWNAAQLEMITTGKMHGYLRMYWAKKILEWSAAPEEALAAAVYLNDKYHLDGNDPNGYAGAAWSIGGVHDRPWFEREIFGKIRYMSYDGCRRKFDTDGYISRMEQAQAGLRV